MDNCKNVVVNYLGRKGAGPVLALEMARGLKANGCKVYVIIPRNIDNLQEWKNASFDKLILIKTYKDILSFVFSTIRFLFVDRIKIRSQLKNINIDICYVPMIQPWSLFINAMFKSAKKIVTLHDPTPHEGSSSIMNFLYKRTVQKANEIVILSNTFIEETCKNYGLKKENIHVIPHGNFSYYSNCARPSVERKQEFNFLFFGRITKYKGLHILSKAYRRLWEKYKNISLYVVGSGNFDEYEQDFLEEENVTVINEFVPDDEVVTYFRGNNIITVLPYLDATQSGVVPIAMYEHSLLIVTNAGGLAEQTGYGKYAILTEPNEDDLYNKMEQAINQYDDFNEMRQAARNYIDSLSWDKLSLLLMELF